MDLPKISRELVIKLATQAYALSGRPGPLPPVFAFAVRGYRSSTMGGPGNDFGIWDDMICLVTPDSFLPENANTDPSRVGWNEAIGKPFAVLQPGVWDFYPGPHKGVSPAFRQADDADVAKRLGITQHDGKFHVLRCYGRNDSRNYLEWGYPQIDIHPGGEVSTSSWACQTLPKPRAKPWLQAGWDALKKYKLKTLTYILVEGPVN